MVAVATAVNVVGAAAVVDATAVGAVGAVGVVGAVDVVVLLASSALVLDQKHQRFQRKLTALRPRKI